MNLVVADTWYAQFSVHILQRNIIDNDNDNDNDKKLQMWSRWQALRQRAVHLTLSYPVLQ